MFWKDLSDTAHPVSLRQVLQGRVYKPLETFSSMVFSQHSRQSAGTSTKSQWPRRSEATRQFMSGSVSKHTSIDTRCSDGTKARRPAGLPPRLAPLPRRLGLLPRLAP